jgi:hypothetical protein
MVKKLLDEQFELMGNHAGFWLGTAKKLRRSADIVFDAYAADLEKLHQGVSTEGLQNLHNLELAGCAMMLYGLGIENLAKGLIVVRGGSAAVNNGKLREWPGPSHSLKTLLNNTGVQLSEQEQDLVTRLTAFVLWAGRYPIPKLAKNMFIPQRNINSPDGWPPLPFSNKEREIYGGLFGRLEAEL